MDLTTVEARLDALESKVAAFEAQDEIRALLLEYCRLNDELTALDELVDLFTDDAVLTNPAGVHRGKDAVRAYLEKVFDGSTEFSRHHVVNPVIEITGADTARVEAYFVALLGKGASSLIAIGRYDDSLVRTADGWRYRTKHNDVLGVTTAEAGWAHGISGGVPLAAKKGD